MAKLNVENINCFFCGKIMTFRETAERKALTCECGEGVFVDHSSPFFEPRGYSNYGPSTYLAPALKYWTEETAAKWLGFERYLTLSFLRLGYCSEEEARDQLERQSAEVDRWREGRRKRYSGFFGLFRKFIDKIW